MSPGESLHLAHLDPEEVAYIGHLTSTLSLDEQGGDALWLRVASGERWWVLETPYGRASYRAVSTHPEDASPDLKVQRWLPIPIRLFRVAIGDTESAGPLTTGPAALSLVDGTTAVLTCPSTSGAIDLVEGVTPPARLSWTESTDVAVPTNRLAGVFWAAYAIPYQARERRSVPYPPMWLRLDESGITIHIDWADTGCGRATYRCAGEFEGEEVMVAVRPDPVCSFIHQLAFESSHEEPDAPCVVSIGEVEFDDEEGTSCQALEIRRGGASLTVWITDPVVERWGVDVLKGIAAADVELVGNDGAEWLVRSFGVDVNITLHHGHPDHVRIASVVWTGTEETLELLHEINQLNSVSAGPRFVVTDGTVRVMTDISCHDKGQIAPSITRVIDDVVTQTRRYAPLLGALAI
ncbi:MAG: hypothetical protein RLZ04_374 [Actinomycetota bacterium]